jgi:hypothetical protein
LKNDEKKWSEILREDRQLVEMEKRCIYCGSTSGLSWEHIVPRSLYINERCPPAIVSRAYTTRYGHAGLAIPEKVQKVYTTFIKSYIPMKVSQTSSHRFLKRNT